MGRAVIDTNVFIPSLLNRKGIPRKVFLAFKKEKFILLISSRILTEILTTLSKPKINSLVKPEDRKELFIFLENLAVSVSPTEKISICRDSADNIILECAAAGKADFIVTGDKDLLALKSFRKIRIITPRKFLEIFS